MNFPAHPIFLVGMMGSGKTTVGRQLASAAGVPFVDLDVRLARLSGQPISDLFGVSEAHFRQQERRCLMSLLAEPGFCARPSVVATGGGCVVDPKNREAMATCGLRVYLQVDVDEAVPRLREAAQRASRPLLGGGPTGAGPRARWLGLHGQRAASYEESELSVRAEGPPSRVVQAILAELSVLPPTADCR